MIKVLTQLLKAGLSGLLAAGMLSVFTLFYFFVGIEHPNPSGATDYRLAPHQPYVEHREGDAVMRLDAYGFNNLDADLDRPINNLMMGDSQMLGMHVSPFENAVALLNKDCPEQYTYNIAMGSHEIYRCVNNLENALQTYAPTTSVLMDVNSVALDPDDMRSVIDGEFKPYDVNDTDLFSWIQKTLPAFTLLYKQAKGWVGFSQPKIFYERLKEWLLPNKAKKGEQITSEEYGSVLTSFLKKAVDSAVRHNVQLIILYIPPTEIEPGGGMVCQTDPEMLALFAGSCERNGIIFLDMTEDFNALYEQEHRAPYGFANTQVGKGHMNKYGYRVVARRLAEVLNDLQEEKKYE